VPAASAEFVAPSYSEAQYAAPQYTETQYAAPQYAEAVAPAQAEPVATYAPTTSDSTWPSYLPNGSASHASGSAEPPAWS
jgi:hypothetical protein